MEKFNQIHCSPIVWNHPSSASALLCLNGANFFKQYLTTPNFTHTENMFVYVNILSMCLKPGMAICCLKTMARFKHTKTEALPDDSTQLVAMYYTMCLLTFLYEIYTRLFIHTALCWCCITLFILYCVYMYSDNVFPHILHGCFTSTETIIRVTQSQLSYPGGYW